MMSATRQEYAVFAKDVGAVRRIRLVADTPDMWRCDRVWLIGPGGEPMEFPVSQSIGWPNNPEATVRSLFASIAKVALVPAALAPTLAPHADVQGDTTRPTRRRD